MHSLEQELNRLGGTLLDWVQIRVRCLGGNELSTGYFFEQSVFAAFSSVLIASPSPLLVYQRARSSSGAGVGYGA